MKIRKILTVTLIMILSLLVACGTDDKESSDEKNLEGKSSAEIQQENLDNLPENPNDKDEESEEQEEGIDEKTGEGYIEGLGKMRVIGVGYNDEVGIDGTDAPIKPIKMGSAELDIENLMIFEIEPDEDGKQLYFDDKDKVVAVSIEMTARNTKDEDIEFHPNQSILVTDTGEQVEPDIMMMGEVGGEFLGKVEKDGETWWVLDKEDTNIKNVKMIISSPYDMEEYEDIAEEKRLEFEILTYKEALKRDKK